MPYLHSLRHKNSHTRSAAAAIKLRRVLHAVWPNVIAFIA